MRLWGDYFTLIVMIILIMQLKSWGTGISCLGTDSLDEHLCNQWQEVPRRCSWWLRGSPQAAGWVQGSTSICYWIPQVWSDAARYGAWWACGFSIPQSSSTPREGEMGNFHYRFTKTASPKDHFHISSDQRCFRERHGAHRCWVSLHGEYCSG